MDRRLPIYFLIDVSESMVGEPVQFVEEGLATIIKELQSDPYALETVWVSILIFAGQAKTLVPLQELVKFYPPRFPIGGGTSYGHGLGHLMSEMRRNIIPTTQDTKGDWKPLVFLFTDGVPTDDTEAVVEEWNRNWRKKVNLVAVSFGADTDTNLLRELTENVLMFQNTTPENYKLFFKWVSASIQATSKEVERNSETLDLGGFHQDVISKVSERQTQRVNYHDTNFAVFAARCQKTTRPYLIKYRNQGRMEPVPGERARPTSFRLVNAFRIDEEYFNLSTESVVNRRVNTQTLEGFPACPYCGNQWGFSVCKCGKIHCVGTEQASKCPWCGNEGRYGFSEANITIERTQG